MGNEDTKELSDKELIKEYIFTLKNVSKIREEYEISLANNKDVFKEFLDSGEYKLEDSTWLVTSNIYIDLSKELIRRGYGEYADIIWGRYFKE